MAKFSSLLTAYRRLDELARRGKANSEYNDDRGFWIGIGVAAAVILGFISELFTNDSRVSILVASVSSGITIPTAKKLSNYFWTKKVESLSTHDRYLDKEKLVEEELRREVAKIKSLGLTDKQTSPLLFEAYKESIRKKKAFIRDERALAIIDTRPEVWNYIPSETRRSQKLLREEEEIRETARAEQDRERIANEIKQLEDRSS